MKRTLAVGLTALCTTAALAACSGRDTATSAGDCDPGITDTEIRFGTSLMQSVAGPQAVAATALFDEINAAGGVTMGDGKTRKIEYIAMDDGYDPARTVGNVRSLVEQEQVFAIQNLIGVACQQIQAESDHDVHENHGTVEVDVRRRDERCDRGEDEHHR
ncbi:ABC transporter substrate-binding protein, partial [Rhodococcus sp. YH1]|uniref:ABC transporter substrate-binding protein n=1 Tax=Rhodococcus sp. YH1 TaxID=89066 RepID=UPI001386F215